MSEHEREASAIHDLVCTHFGQFISCKSTIFDIRRYALSAYSSSGSPRRRHRPNTVAASFFPFSSFFLLLRIRFTQSQLHVSISPAKITARSHAMSVARMKRAYGTC